ncbi:7101_t:CDS:2 [Paraglomus brasilianum]|uniref:ATP synthase subunit 5, mitochondrial n=1 Tax=Paraglomus brasilianum TaxID=144538 RepID=A0A9N9FGV6_9GLOM|nr:7101_t:CDS:2 [Paraglomus brasilianum]
MASLTRLTLGSVVPKLARGYATAGGSSVQVPLVVYGIDGRYATALYSAAAKKSNTKTVEGDLKQIESVITKNSTIRTFLADPSVAREAKKEGVRRLLKQGKYSELTNNFFDLLAENGRLGETERVIQKYLQIMVAERGEIPITITSVGELDKKTETRLKTLLSKSRFVKPNQTPIIANKVDPNILGGFIIEIGEDQTVDLSAASRIARLNKLLTDAI